MTVLEQAFLNDLDDREAPLSRIVMPEGLLLARLNACLAHEGRDLACAIVALRPYDSQLRNWEVAKFTLGDSPVADVDARITRIARIVASAASDIDVDWPTVALH